MYWKIGLEWRTLNGQLYLAEVGHTMKLNLAKKFPSSTTNNLAKKANRNIDLIDIHISFERSALFHHGTQNRILGKSLTVHNMYYSECGSGWFFFPLLTEKRNKLLSPGGEWTVNTCFFDSASADLYLENEIKFATFILFKKVELSSWHVLMACSIFFKIGVVKVNLIFNYGKQRVGSRRP
jgi:hypothetical protein